MTPQFSILPNLHLLQHPFYKAWMEGQLSIETLQDYAQQYYHHVEAFPRYLQIALQHPQTERSRSILKENLDEEDGTTYGISHPELWLRFAEGLKTDRDNVKNAKLRDGIKNVVHVFTENSQASCARALGALYAYESQVPEIADSKIKGLKENYGIQDERTLSFFEIHKTADVAHRESLLQIINELPQSEKNEAQLAANQACQALWNFLTDAYEQKH